MVILLCCPKWPEGPFRTHSKWFIGFIVAIGRLTSTQVELFPLKTQMFGLEQRSSEPILPRIGWYGNIYARKETITFEGKKG